MKAGWRTEPLKAVCQLINRGISPAYIENGGVAVLNQKCVRDHTVNFDLGRRHNDKEKRVSADKFLRAGDVLVNSTGTGTLGRVAQLRDTPIEPTTVDSHVTVVRPNDGLFYPEFFGYALIAIEEQIQEGGEGCGGQTELARSKLANDYRVSFPEDIRTQQRIVTLLDEAFDGIANAKANAEKNLQNARGLFDSYLQSEFTRQGDGVQETTLGEVCDFVGGSQPPKSVFMPNKTAENIRLIQIRDYKSDQYLVYIPRSLARRFCDVNDVMIGRYGPPLFQILRGLEGAYNVALMKAVPDEKRLSRDYLFYFLKHSTILEYVIYHSSRAAGQIGLTKDTLEPYPIFLPPLGKQLEIVAKTVELEAETHRLESIYQQKLTALEELKKSLLHRAFNGEL